MEPNFEKEYPKTVLEKNIKNEKYNTKMQLKLKTDDKTFCLLTYLPEHKEYVAYSIFEIKKSFSKTLYLWYLGTTKNDVAGKGLGYENMRFLLGFAKKENCQTFEFRYCPKNQSAVELYKKFPFTKFYDDYEQYMTLQVAEFNCDLEK